MMQIVRVLAAIGLAAATLVLAACGGAEENASEASGPATAPATTAAGQSEPLPDSAPATTEEPSRTETGATGEPRTEASSKPVVIELEDGEPVGGPATIEVRSGGTVRLRVLSDTPDEIHVHGYDLEATVGPGEPAELIFEAEFEGIFEIETHGSGALVAELRVEP